MRIKGQYVEPEWAVIGFFACLASFYSASFVGWCIIEFTYYLIWG